MPLFLGEGGREGREWRGKDVTTSRARAVNSIFLTPKQAKDSTAKGNYRPVLLLITDGKYSVKCFLKIGGTQ